MHCCEVSWNFKQVAFYISKQLAPLTYPKLPGLVESGLGCLCCPGILPLWTLWNVWSFLVSWLGKWHHSISVNLACGINPEQSYVYILQWAEPVYSTGIIDFRCSSSNYFILSCHVGTTFWFVQETPRPQNCSYPWCVAFTLTRTFSKRMPVLKLVTVRGWHCMRTSRVFFSPYLGQTAGSVLSTLKPLSLSHFIHLGKKILSEMNNIPLFTQ